MSVEQIERMPFDEAVAAGKVICCQEELDAKYVELMKAQSLGEARDLKILYSPLHGVGATAVVPALAADGFTDVEVFALHAEPNADFPNVPGNVSNPENPAVFDAIIERGKEIGADLIMASDPDCDRIGCAAPKTSDSAGPWATMTGNQIGALLTEYILASRKKKGMLSAEHYVVKTLVTTEMVRRIADSYGVITYGDLLVGFKWIGGLIDEKGPGPFCFWDRRIARLSGRPIRPRQRRRRGGHATGRACCRSQDGRRVAASKTRIALLAIRLSRRAHDFGHDAGLGRDGADENGDGKNFANRRPSNWPGIDVVSCSRLSNEHGTGHCLWRIAADG